MNYPHLRTLLIVDAEPALLDVMCDVLRSQGYRCIPAHKPIEAISVCESDETIDLVVSDFNMPTMNGFELWNVICQLRPNLRILFVSANADACQELADNG